MRSALTVLVFFTMVAIACAPTSPATPDLKSTVEALVEKRLGQMPSATATFAPTSEPRVTSTATPVPTPTPDMQATVSAAVTTEAAKKPRPKITPVPTITPTLAHSATPTAKPTPLATPTPTPRPAPTLTADSYAARGYSLIDAGEYASAIEELTVAIQLDPSHKGAYQSRGFALLKLGRHNRAIDDLDQAIRLGIIVGPVTWTPYYNRGAAYRSLGEYQRAVQDYTEAIRLAPNKDAPYGNRAFAYMDMADWQSAIRDLSKAIQLDPSYAVWFDARAYAYSNLGQNQLAERDQESACQLDNVLPCHLPTATPLPTPTLICTSPHPNELVVEQVSKRLGDYGIGLDVIGRINNTCNKAITSEVTGIAYDPVGNILAARTLQGFELNALKPGETIVTVYLPGAYDDSVQVEINVEFIRYVN